MYCVDKCRNFITKTFLHSYFVKNKIVRSWLRSLSRFMKKQWKKSMWHFWGKHEVFQLLTDCSLKI